MPTLIGFAAYVLQFPSLVTTVSVGWGVAYLFGQFALNSKFIWTLAEEDVRAARKWHDESELRNLRRRLSRDKDHRTSQLVRDLRDAYITLPQVPTNGESSYSPDRITHLKGQYDTCLHSLKRSVELWESANRSTSHEKREQYLKDRDALLSHVANDIHNLGVALDGLRVEPSSSQPSES